MRLYSSLCCFSFGTHCTGNISVRCNLKEIPHGLTCSSRIFYFIMAPDYWGWSATNCKKSTTLLCLKCVFLQFEKTVGKIFGWKKIQTYSFFYLKLCWMKRSPAYWRVTPNQAPRETGHISIHKFSNTCKWEYFREKSCFGRKMRYNPTLTTRIRRTNERLWAGIPESGVNYAGQNIMSISRCPASSFFVACVRVAFPHFPQPLVLPFENEAWKNYHPFPPKTNRNRSMS